MDGPGASNVGANVFVFRRAWTISFPTVVIGDPFHR